MASTYSFPFAYEITRRGGSRNYDIVASQTLTNQTVFDSTSAGRLTTGEAVTTTQGAGSYTGNTIGGYPIIQVGRKLYLFTDSANLNGRVIGSSNNDLTVLCLTAGSKIKLTSGQSVDVSELNIGDMVQTTDGPKPVRFIGVSTYSLFQLSTTGKLPIRIEANAFGDLGPSQPIHCTPNHAFAIKGCLVEAQALINGTTVRQQETWDEPSVTYYSLELEGHSLVWANDLLSETYVATERNGSITRESWDNFSDYLTHYGTSTPMADMPMPRIPFARQLPPEIREIAGITQSDSEAVFALV